MSDLEETPGADAASANALLLAQARRMVETLDDARYREGAPTLALSGIGAHLRHCLDVYDCFLAGVPTGRVDYDARVRDERVETERERALERIDAVLEGLRRLPRAATPLRVRHDVGADHDGAEEGFSRSTLARELRFLASHTVHHYALIAVLLRHHGLEPENGFGVAPSTLRYWERLGPLAR